MENSKISIIVPVYNAEEYLPRCLDSLINQTYENIEIICINDASTDNSLSVLQKYKRSDERIKIIDKENEDVSFARNAGLRASQGEYVMFVDSDDWIDVNTCELALQQIVENTADVVIWNYISEHNSSSVKKEIFINDKIVFENNDVQKKIHRRFIGIVGEELSCPEKADSLCTVWGKLYRKSVIDENNIEFPDIRKIGTYEDGLFNLYLFKYVKKAVYINKALYHYRRTNFSSVTSGYKPDFEEQWHNLFDIMERYINENDLPNVYRQALNNRIALSVLGLGLNELKSPRNSLKKINHIKQMLKLDKYKRAYKELKLDYFPIYWKVFYACVKFNFALGVYILLLCIRRIINS